MESLGYEVYIPEGLITLTAWVYLTVFNVNPHGKPPIIAWDNIVKFVGVKFLPKKIQEISNIVTEALKFQLTLYFN